MGHMGLNPNPPERFDDLGFQGSELGFGILSFDSVDMQQWSLVHFVYHSHGLRVESGITGELVELDLPLRVLHHLHCDGGNTCSLPEHDISRDR